MNRNWERERNYWLDHFGQYHPGSRRNSDKSGITPEDYIGIPTPLNLSIPAESALPHMALETQGRRVRSPEWPWCPRSRLRADPGTSGEGGSGR